ncbi:MAG: vWA domain-containing protein [bacterium]
MRHRVFASWGLTVLGFHWLQSCEYRQPTTPSAPVTEFARATITELESFDAKLNCYTPWLEPPAKVVTMFTVKDDSGKPVTGLTCADFQLYEDGEPISPSESDFSVQEKPANFTLYTLLLLDVSGSVVPVHLGLLKDAAEQFVLDILQEATTRTSKFDFALYVFAGEPRIIPLIEFGHDSTHILSTIRNLHNLSITDRSTDLHGAVRDGVRLLNGSIRMSQVPKVAEGALALFTDGTDRADRFPFDSARVAIENNKDRISSYVLGVGSEINRTRLSILGHSGFVFADTLTPPILREAFRKLAGEIKKEVEGRYLLQYCSPKRRGNHTLQVKVLRGSGQYSYFTVSYSADRFTGGCVIPEENVCQNETHPLNSVGGMNAPVLAGMNLPLDYRESSRGATSISSLDK